MTGIGTSPPGNQEGRASVPVELRGDTISYALQHMVYNLAANVYEPAIDSYLQGTYANRYEKGNGHGSYGHNLVGQVAGDVAGGAALIGAELLIPNQLHAVTRAARRLIDPLYDSVARWVLSDHCHDPDYAQQIERWKVHQERSFVRSAIMMPASLASNVALQKAIGNPSPAKVIFASKLISTALTNVIVLASRFAFPEKTRRLDRWINDKVVLPLMDDRAAESDQYYHRNAMKNKNKTHDAPVR